MSLNYRWTNKEHETYCQIESEDLDNKLYAGIISKKRRTDILLKYLNEELEERHITDNLEGCEFSFRDILVKFNTEKSHEGLNMLEKAAIVKITKNSR